MRTTSCQRTFRLIGIRGVLTILTVLALISACANAKEIHWEEQVRLSSGEVMVIERGEKLRSVYDGGPFRPGWLFDEAWLKAKLPGVGETFWQGALSPLVLDVTTRGEWYLLGIVRTSPGGREYRLSGGKRYVAFRLQEGTWRRIPFVEFPEQFAANLLANTSRLFLIEDTPNGSTVNFDMKQKVDSVLALDRAYKIIDRSLGE
jgi:hypothetical protein